MKQKKEGLLIKGAKIAKEQGFVFICSLVKRYKYTDYWHVVKIEDVLSAGKWIPAPFKRMRNGYRKVGVTKLPPGTIERKLLFKLTKIVGG